MWTRKENVVPCENERSTILFGETRKGRCHVRKKRKVGTAMRRKKGRYDFSGEGRKGVVPCGEKRKPRW
jgi:hypothetical protein